MKKNRVSNRILQKKHNRRTIAARNRRHWRQHCILGASSWYRSFHSISKMPTQIISNLTPTVTSTNWPANH